MRILEWRKANNMSRVKMAELLGIDTPAANPSSKLRNYELGVSAVPIHLIPKIIELTGGDVSLEDMVAIRQDFVAANSEPSPEPSSPPSSVEPENEGA